MSDLPVPRVALLFEYATLNGGERSMLAALDWLQQQKTRFEFVAIAAPTGRLADALQERGIAVRGWSPRDAHQDRRSASDIESSLHEVVSSLQPHLLHANSLAMGRLVGRLADRLDIPTTTHLRDIIKLSSAAVADLNRNARLVAVSKATRDFHVAQGIRDSQVAVVTNGIDLEQFRPRTSVGRLHEELGLPYPGAKLVATIGQIGLRKGQDVLAAAAAAIVGQVPDAHFVLIGERTSQKEESIEFERAVSRTFALSGRVDRLHLLGHRDDVATLLNDVDLLIHSANQEPFGRVLLEASAAAVPIVATDVGGTAEIVLNNVTGLLVPARDATALANAAIAILTDTAKANRFRLAARERAVEQFPIALSAERLGNVWSGVLDAVMK